VGSRHFLKAAVFSSANDKARMKLAPSDCELFGHFSSLPGAHCTPTIAIHARAGLRDQPWIVQVASFVR